MNCWTLAGLAHLLELVVDDGGARVPSLILVLAPRAGRGD
jgi:hypothetical protein